jgi:hypothetical protein
VRAHGRPVNVKMLLPSAPQTFITFTKFAKFAKFANIDPPGPPDTETLAGTASPTPLRPHLLHAASPSPVSDGPGTHEVGGG